MSTYVLEQTSTSFNYFFQRLHHHHLLLLFSGVDHTSSSTSLSSFFSSVNIFFVNIFNICRPHVKDIALCSWLSCTVRTAVASAPVTSTLFLFLLHRLQLDKLALRHQILFSTRSDIIVLQQQEVVELLFLKLQSLIVVLSSRRRRDKPHNSLT